ncbi:hypothetical protein G6O67_000685 [Ophiocordyceps sinensis]|uniref:Uncharacterized protein n=2 Tax=Ophiocordyceps sinensis TaxID=72228 RepID=A0A8H4PZP7_9HYPO|nr:hypothetical protein OCS_01688 [Ophiocordyceps sinensis CO18]KAF4513412.1 hypothetical protein G6O67_000685 [Ophiocordyceps sinensis]
MYATDAYGNKAHLFTYMDLLHTCPSRHGSWRKISVPHEPSHVTIVDGEPWQISLPGHRPDPGLLLLFSTGTLQALCVVANPLHPTRRPSQPYHLHLESHRMAKSPWEQLSRSCGLDDKDEELSLALTVSSAATLRLGAPCLKDGMARSIGSMYGTWEMGVDAWRTMCVPQGGTMPSGGTIAQGGTISIDMPPPVLPSWPARNDPSLLHPARDASGHESWCADPVPAPFPQPALPRPSPAGAVMLTKDTRCAPEAYQRNEAGRGVGLGPG